MLASQEAVNIAMSLQGQDALTLIDILDQVSKLTRIRATLLTIPAKVFEMPNITLNLRRRIVGILQRVCCSQTILPRSCILSDISKEADIAFSSGGSGDVWKGRHNGKPVRVKTFCADAPENLHRAKQVCTRCGQVQCDFRLTVFGSTYSRKLWSGGISLTQTSCKCWVSPQSRSPCASSRNGRPTETSRTSRQRTPRSTAFASYADISFTLILNSDCLARSSQR
jgi:hypothetical protein